MSRGTFGAALAAGVIAAASPGCGGSDERPTRAVRDTAEWRTWVVAPGAGARLPALSADADAVRPGAAQVRAWDELRRAGARSSVAPWFELAMRFVADRAKDPPAASRAYALVGVASYDAAVAAAQHAKALGAEDAPSQETAIAGAASRVLAHAFPEHPRARLDALAERSAAWHVAQRRTTTRGARSGLAIGRSVAGRVIARVRDDRPQHPPAVRPPDEPGAWRPPPGSTARPVQPGAGRWATWVLPRGNAVRPPPPPRYGSAEYLAETREVMELRPRLTREQRHAAHFWAGGEGTELPPGIWVRVVLAHLDAQGIGGARAARVMALLTVAMADAGVAAWDAKYAYWTTRPENAIRDLLDPAWRPLIDTPFFPAYPSGHATYSAAAAEVLAHLFPRERAVWRERAEEAAMSRLFGGIHFRSDSTVGAAMGRRIGRLIVRWAERDGVGP